MKRKTAVYAIDQPELVKLQALTWVQSFDHFNYFTDNNFSYPFGGFINLLAAGCAGVCPIVPGNTFQSIQHFSYTHQDWMVGFFSYDLKNEIEELKSQNLDFLQFPLAYFYIPQHLIHFKSQQLIIESVNDPDEIYHQIIAIQPATQRNVTGSPNSIQQRTSKEVYLQNVAHIRNHILEGDVYEMNYCVEFYAESATIDPLQTYLALNQRSAMPFSVLQRIREQYLLCASPERFLKKTDSQLISQPIKGTARRGATTADDAKIAEQLRNDEKEIAENMMIVDLVRNDLARSAETGSVKVEEMFGVYTFPQLHQMISTISARLKPSVSFTEAIRNAFPMGSMTGAPKIKAMELIEQYEDTRRGLYSGTVGYITPQGNFDFNVVIRSILYNAAQCYAAFQVGSAITYDSVAVNEYEECLLKAKTMLEVLTGNKHQIR